MSLTEISTIASIVSSIAVAITLIYLAIQTHQNAKHTKALIQQGRLGAIRELALSCAESDFASAILRGLSGSSTAEEIKRFQFQNYCGASFFGWQDTFLQYDMGLLDEDIYLQMRSSITRAMTNPGFRAAWETIFRVPGTKFATFVDEVSSISPANQPQPGC